MFIKLMSFERHRAIKLKTISEGQGFEVPNNIHFRFGKRRNTSNFFAPH